MLRFKKEDGSDYPNWEKRLLGDITKEIKRKADTGSTAPIMMISQGKGFIYQSDKYSRENAGQSLAKYTLLKRGEMAYNHGASKAKPYGVAYSLKEEEEARVPFVYHSFEIIDGVTDYWNYALNTTQMDRQLKKLVSSGARMDGLLNINYDTYMQTQIHTPCNEEQIKIAQFLNKVDKKIENQEKIIADFEKLQKCTMQKIFDQEIRFKDDNNISFPSWQEKQLGEVCTYRRGSFPQPYGLEEWYDDENGKPFVQVADVGDNMRLNPTTKRHISKLAESKSIFVKKGTMLITLQGTIGKVAVTDYDAYVDRTLLILQNLNSEINIDYFKFAIWWIFNEEKKKADGSIIKTITKETLTNFIVKIPCLDEQEKISNCLSTINRKIEIEKAILEDWKELRKGLLQQMFV